MKITTVIAGIALLLASSVAFASDTSDALSQCLGRSASTGDRRVLVRWIYSVMSSHPDLADLSAIDPQRRTTLEADAARVMERLIADDCAAEVKTALVADGTNGFSSAFEALGKLAMQDFLTHPDVAKASAAVGERIDQKRVLKALLSK
ncbi:hypothetical protein DWG18_09170 [Lysobacter sp. TY2-98]|uniref:hypothetical protein n=1 Tax=Lysobacter sp. TY2-98 TaxID=2290922 RepID=UPI000E1FE4BB|nr:hypothetical protein [Lysobacter sp. TY2-98]AXK72423.1 hypothetical protein DWG18_09170 [Lysobacter sp. TY2-98]